MNGFTLAALALLFSLVGSSFADLSLRPTTTLARETGNNTSTANGFRGQPTGNLGAGNVSKLPIRSLLYPGSQTQIFARVLHWWGHKNHVDVGYNSQDAAQVRRQVEDMISRGIDGVIIDWYGPGSFEDLGTRHFLKEAENHPGFKVIVSLEHGGVLWGSCHSKCGATQAVLELARSAAQRFFSSPAYARSNGRPILMEFGMENVPQKINWKKVKREAPGEPIWVHRNPSGFKKEDSGGAYAWLRNQRKEKKTPGWDGSSYLNEFYQIAKADKGKQVFGSVYKGFDDTIASWAPPGGKHIEQRCGQTWLKTFDVINRNYSAADPLPAMQLVTWNDYEEGTALEPGIDNCVEVSASIADGVLTWKISGGKENTIDHFVVFVSADRTNLMPLGEFSAGTRTLNLRSFDLASGAYTVYVKAVGKPSISNKMSAGVHYSPNGAAPGGNPTGFAPDSSGAGSAGTVLDVQVNPGTVKVVRGKSAQVRVMLKPAAPVNGQVLLACSDLPAGVSCAFSPAVLVPGASPAEATLTVSAKSLNKANKASLYHGSVESLFALAFPGLGIVGVVMLGSARMRRSVQLVVAVAIAAAILILAACGGGSSSMLSDAPATPGTYSIKVSAVSSAVQQSTTATVVIE
ncbi:MAG: hypothetical protein AB7O65_01510 [Candidatus Korobacteraceae bacterium]